MNAALLTNVVGKAVQHQRHRAGDWTHSDVCKCHPLDALAGFGFMLKATVYDAETFRDVVSVHLLVSVQLLLEGDKLFQRRFVHSHRIYRGIRQVTELVKVQHDVGPVIESPIFGFKPMFSGEILSISIFKFEREAHHGVVVVVVIGVLVKRRVDRNEAIHREVVKNKLVRGIAGVQYHIFIEIGFVQARQRRARPRSDPVVRGGEKSTMVPPPTRAPPP